MRADEALSLLGLSNGPHKPIEIDKAAIKLSNNDVAKKPDSSKAVNVRQPEDSLIASDLSITNRIDIWDSLVFGWVYLSDSEIEQYELKELCSIRRERLLSERAIDFQAAIKADFPERIEYPWDLQTTFGNFEELCSLEHQKAALVNEMVSDTIVRCKIARARFRALYLDPTLLWVEGTCLESKSGDTLSCDYMGWNYWTEMGDRDYISWDFLTPEECGNLYRLRYPEQVENYLFKISKIFGNCGVVNALRLVILYGGFGFDGYGHVSEALLSDLNLSITDFCWIAVNILKCQIYRGLPFGIPVDVYDNTSTESPIGKGCIQICYIPISQRKAMTRNGSLLNELYPDDNSLCDALAKSWQKRLSQPIDLSGEPPAIPVAENMLRALCELDGADASDFGVMDEFLSPKYEAYDCLMREPEFMTISSSFEDRSSIIAEFNDYWYSRRRHKQAYNHWMYRQSSTVFEKIKSFLSSLLGTILLAIFPVFIIPEAGIFFTLSGGRLNILDHNYWWIPAGVAIVLGILAALWDAFSWPLHVSWDRRIKSIPRERRWLYELDTLGGSLIAAYIGSSIGLVVSLISGNVSIDTQTGLHYAIVLGFTALLVTGYLMARMPGDWHAIFDSNRAKEEPVRSEWEEQIARHVTSKFPTLEVETNNRTIIKAPGKGKTYYEIDIWIPELKLGIEANGEQYHDHEMYKRDTRYGTTNSREMYKEKYCEERGIKLVHIWSSDTTEHIFDTIDYEIGKRMQNVALRPIA